MDRVSPTFGMRTDNFNRSLLRILQNRVHGSHELFKHNRSEFISVTQE